MKKKKEIKLAYEYLQVIINLWKNQNIQYYSPYGFKEIIGKMERLFQGIQANDSKDLIIFLLENLHNELNAVNEIKPFHGYQNQYNFQISFQNYCNYFKLNYKSKISDLFYGMNNSMITCLNCFARSNNISCYNILIFPLENVRIYKNIANNKVNIYECFEQYQSNTFLYGDNQIYCNNCKSLANNLNVCRLLITPRILIINLNRGRGIQFKVDLQIEEFIDLKNYVYLPQSPHKYQLIGIIAHLGPSGNSGHYIAFCKSFVDNNWYKYNDGMVNLSYFQEAISSGLPYVLFYSQIDDL